MKIRIKKQLPVIIIAALILVMLILNTASILPKTRISVEIQDKVPGAEYVNLSEGRVQYESAGSGDTGTVILVSGFSVPYYCYDHIFIPLVSEGYRVIRYNLYGRGFSDRVDSDYTIELFVTQLSEFLEALNINEPIFLTGLSMGGMISAAYTAEYPEKVEKLVLISPAGYYQAESFATKMVKFPLIGDFIMNVFGDRTLTSRNKTNLYHKDQYPEFFAGFEDQLNYRGFKTALLSTLRNVPMYAGEAYYDQLGDVDVPVLLLWGEHDEVIPFEQHLLVEQAVPRAEFVKITDAGHNSQYEAPEQILSAMIGYFE